LGLETDDMIGWKYGQRQGLVRVISVASKAMSWLVLFRNPLGEVVALKDYTTYIPMASFEAFDQGMELR